MGNSQADVVEKKIEYAGRSLVLQTGRYAEQADAAVLAQYGDTMVLATIVHVEAAENKGFLPLRIDYEEKLYAGGKIKGSRFVKREGRPSDEAVLKARAIDRSIRPLFPKDFFHEIQVILTVLSVDSNTDPTVLSLIAVSAALSISGLPWDKVLTPVRVGLNNGNFILNPSLAEMKFSSLDLLASIVGDSVVMIESSAEEVAEDQIIKAIEFAQENTQPLADLITEFADAVGKPKITYVSAEVDPQVKANLSQFINDNLPEQVYDIDQRMRAETVNNFLETLNTQFEGKASKAEIKQILELLMKKIMRQRVVSERKRFDGRGLDEVRPVDVEVGLLPRTHGSAVFKRGGTQVLTVVTLASTSLEQLIETMTGEETKRYIHHYNFLPFSTGEIGYLAYPKRREIGHGALAEKALLPVIPSEAEFPYTIRVVSEILSSAGSTSQASVCGSSLALMDAGVPIKSDVAGLAMGLIVEGGEQLVLTDIAGLEDSFGDMDLKIAGTEKGITAIQLDVKIDNVPLDTIAQAITQAHQGRMQILEEMRSVINNSRQKISQYAPSIVCVEVDPKNIGKIIGPGGRTVRSFQEATETTIDIKDDGRVLISGFDPDKVEKAKQGILGLNQEVKVGQFYEGTVKQVVDFGAFVEVIPGQDGLVHVSEINESYVDNVSDYLSEGDQVRVKVIEIDEKDRINLSIKQARSDEQESAEDK
ncbi:polyribonucleotide nucleotidyltransferase [Patescibacteria group bacterium]|nr:polyribonucleotide nucleotidyltransferase [Patescibacteria group bacterium]